MDADGYPEDHELEAIEKWDYKDVFNLLEYIKARHQFEGYLTFNVYTEDYKPYKKGLEVHYSTAGWSGNESMIHALLRNTFIKMFFYYSWRTGGHYVFRIMPEQVGFKLVRDYCKENKISKQAIYQSKDKYEWYSLGTHKNYIRLK